MIILELVTYSFVALWFAVALLILFREKYPKWWFDWNVAVTKFSVRVTSYLLLMSDEYPSTDEDQAVKIEILYPDVKSDLNRWMPIVKWILVIPHIIALIFMWIVCLLGVVFSLFAILFTGRYPRPVFDFTESLLCWNLRVSAYAFLLTTDQYPPFRLRE